MDTARDLACPEPWQQSLERSLARRGRPTRSSPELFRLQPERDLVQGDVIRESIRYSQMRRAAASRRPAMALPGAGGISALALLAATTMPGLLGGRGAGAAAGRERIAFRADASAPPLPKTRDLPAASDAGLATSSQIASDAGIVRGTGVPAHAVPSATAGRATTAASAHAARHIAAAHDATASGGAATTATATSSGGAAVVHPAAAAHPTAPATRHATSSVHRVASVAHHVSGSVRGATAHPAPATHKPSAAAPAHLKHVGHTGSGGGAIEEQSSPTTSTQAHPKDATHPKPVAHPNPAARPKPAAPQPVAVSKPTTKPTATPAPAPASGYVNPLAGASVTPERIDQGVDYSGSGTLGAIGAGKITYVGTSGTGWPGAFIEYQLTSGSDAGRYVYYAESVSPAAGLHVGQTVQAGQPIAQINGGIEVGWGSGVGTQPLAQADGQWSSGSDASNVATADGKDFSALIASLGGPPGKVEG